ncbi:single-strand selective monofunctional uracil DNA glycosylase-like [Patiria miniata]|uniref:Uracil-DNA glycosylase-like domain-containing protein n=1 Tax=Patiria miniata TaxID=46514 RepID=A0A913ZD45_PATMI|nr:single-strand selective monofunctional uracil DNA glycosylase-like [Patiria miniata]XP_038049439.1 single-strand selective monofunctional uracil DNA glycosylase-like [Patiria miniata]
MPRKRAAAPDQSAKPKKVPKSKQQDGADEPSDASLKQDVVNATGDAAAAAASAAAGNSTAAAAVPTSSGGIADRFLSELVAPFNRDVAGMKFGKPVEYVYNPLEYASEPHEDFIRKYCNSTKEVLFLGMNPGPFGMAQNGVPFGERDSVNDFLGIKGNVGKPPKEHPKRQIVGLSCDRKEVSGSRFWGLWKSLCKTPEAFFRHAFVYNHCSLVFMSETGKNITPPGMLVGARKQIVELCDTFICKMIQLLEVKVVVGIGKFAEERAKKALAAGGVEGVRVVTIMHPSPINPAANKGWDEAVIKQLTQLDLLKYFKE